MKLSDVIEDLLIIKEKYVKQLKDVMEVMPCNFLAIRILSGIIYDIELFIMTIEESER